MYQARGERLSKARGTSPTPSTPQSITGEYVPEKHADISTLAAKMSRFGSTAFKPMKR
jgi:hypothetical protein